jgi:hypothetical protein
VTGAGTVHTADGVELAPLMVVSVVVVLFEEFVTVNVVASVPDPPVTWP